MKTAVQTDLRTESFAFYKTGAVGALKTVVLTHPSEHFLEFPSLKLSPMFHVTSSLSLFVWHVALVRGRGNVLAAGSKVGKNARDLEWGQLRHLLAVPSGSSQCLFLDLGGSPRVPGKHTVGHNLDQLDCTLLAPLLPLGSALCTLRLRGPRARPGRHPAPYEAAPRRREGVLAASEANSQPFRPKLGAAAQGFMPRIISSFLFLFPTEESACLVLAPQDLLLWR